MPGDGRFDVATAGPPKGVPVLLRLSSDASHTGVATDVANMEKAINALLQARPFANGPS